uniref:Uncharacterized protein n=1 Tax=Anguilla anguilla TaxID=7936 RepID=A0A0E9XVH6_ANGAN
MDAHAECSSNTCSSIFITTELDLGHSLLFSVFRMHSVVFKSTILDCVITF